MPEAAHAQTSLERRRREIGTRFRALREARGLSQTDLAQLADCSKSHICQIENGNGSFSFRFFLAACDALEADPAFVFARVRAASLDDLYAKFESTVATLGRPAMEFLLSLGPAEMRILCERAQEVVAYRAASGSRTCSLRARLEGVTQAGQPAQPRVVLPVGVAAGPSTQQPVEGELVLCTRAAVRSGDLDAEPFQARSCDLEQQRGHALDAALQVARSLAQNFAPGKLARLVFRHR